MEAATTLEVRVDTEIERYEGDRKRRLKETLGNEPQEARRIKMMALRLSLKKPGLKTLMGESPLKNEEFDELEKYFKLSKRST